MKKTLFFSIVSLLLLAHTALASFSDIESSHYYYESISWLEDQGVVVGYADGEFKPKGSVNRAEFLKMLYETVGMENEDTTLPFSDVPDNQWYSKYVKEAYATGVIDGYPDGTFRPGNPINFAEAIKIVTNGFFPVDSLYGSGESYIPCLMDLRYMEGNWYWKYFSVADTRCLLPPVINSESHGFNEADYVTRGDMAEILYRAKAVKDNGYNNFAEEMQPAKIQTSMYCKQATNYTNRAYGFTFSCPTNLYMLDIYGSVFASNNEIEYNDMMNGYFAPILIEPTNETRNASLLDNTDIQSEEEVIADGVTGTQYIGTTGSYLPYQTHSIILTVFPEKNLTIITLNNVLSEEEIDYNEVGDEIIENLFFY